MTRSFSFAPTAVAVVALTLSAAAWAKVPAGEADRLGQDRTCVGAAKAGSKADMLKVVDFLVEKERKERAAKQGG